jgi:magnesium transporter
MPDKDLLPAEPQQEPVAPAESLPPEGEHPADTADRLENLEFNDQVRLIASIPPREAAESIAEMEKHERIDLMSQLTPDKAADLIAEMSPDDAADILVELDEDMAQRVLTRVGKRDAAEIRKLMRYEPDTAGGVMNTEIVVLDQKLTADEAIKVIRSEIEDKEVPYYAYLVDEDDHLVGVLTMRDLILARPRKMLSDLVKSQILVSVTFDVDKEEVAQLIGRYNFLAIPVVDYEERLLGVVTHDDIIDIIHEEATEDMQKMVGAASDETVDSPWTYSLVRRLPWLLVNVANSSISAWVVHLFEGTIAQMAILAVLMPLVANQAGNTGQQALAVMIRQLALEKFDRRKSWVAVLRELKIGLVSGAVISVLVLAAVYALTRSIHLAEVMGLAMGLDMLLGALAGASIPLILKELGRDPAQASSIFLTTLTDSTGFFLLLGLAQLFLI